MARFGPLGACVFCGMGDRVEAISASCTFFVQFFAFRALDIIGVLAAGL